MKFKKNLFLTLICAAGLLVACGNKGGEGGQSHNDVPSEQGQEGNEGSQGGEGEGQQQHVHTPGSAVIENRVNKTCTADGSYDEVVYCSGCGEEISREHKIDAATGHVEINDPDHMGSPATYYEVGHTQGKKCEVCGEVVEQSVEIPRKTLREEIEEVSSIDDVVLNSVLLNKIKMLDQTTEGTTGVPVYGHAQIPGYDGDSDVLYFSQSDEWSETVDDTTNYGFSEFRFPATTQYTKSVTFSYKYVDFDQDSHYSAGHDKAYMCKSYVQLKVTDEGYINAAGQQESHFSFFVPDGQWHTVTVDTQNKQVEFLLLNFYHFKGEIVFGQLSFQEHDHKEVNDPDHPAANATYYAEGSSQGTICEICHQVMTAHTVLPKKTLRAEINEVSSISDPVLSSIVTSKIKQLDQTTEGTNGVPVFGRADVNGEEHDVLYLSHSTDWTDTIDESTNYGLSEFRFPITTRYTKSISITYKYVDFNQNVSFPNEGDKAYMCKSFMELKLDDGSYINADGYHTSYYELFNADGQWHTATMDTGNKVLQNVLFNIFHFKGELIIGKLEIAEHDHDPVDDAAVAATCTEAGHTAGTHCSICGDVLSGNEDVPALGHEMVANTTNIGWEEVCSNGVHHGNLKTTVEFSSPTDYGSGSDMLTNGTTKIESTVVEPYGQMLYQMPTGEDYTVINEREVILPKINFALYDSVLIPYITNSDAGNGHVISLGLNSVDDLLPLDNTKSTKGFMEFTTNDENTELTMVFYVNASAKTVVIDDVDIINGQKSLTLLGSGNAWRWVCIRVILNHSHSFGAPVDSEERFGTKIETCSECGLIKESETMMDEIVGFTNQNQFSAFANSLETAEKTSGGDKYAVVGAMKKAFETGEFKFPLIQYNKFDSVELDIGVDWFDDYKCTLGVDSVDEIAFATIQATGHRAGKLVFTYNPAAGNMNLKIMFGETVVLERTIIDPAVIQGTKQFKLLLSDAYGRPSSEDPTITSWRTFFLNGIRGIKN